MAITTIQLSQDAPRDTAADAIVLGVFQGEDGPLPAPGAEDVDAALGGEVASMLALLGAKGKAEEVTLAHAGGRLAAPVIAAVGLGKPADPGDAVDAETLRRAAGAAVRSLTAAKLARITLSLPARDEAEAEAVALGALLGGYSFTRYRTPRDAPPEPQLALLAPAAYGESALARAQALADAIGLARDLINTSPVHLPPAAMAERAEQVAADAGLDVSVLDETALKDSGYGGITAVGQGSARPPRLVRLAYVPKGGPATKTVAFIGKGITFDSGGLSLKPNEGMMAMKSDMSGAAAVLGALQAIAALGPAVNVVGYLPLAENMPGGGAQRPSDVITIYGGKTVEVLNTDAEGRLVLADGLVRAAEDKPDLIVDIATLTGAQVVALGGRTFGVMASEDAVREGVADAARRAGEAAWPMPLPEGLRKGLDSSVADIANVSNSREGGMLVAGLFLREFIQNGSRWAHLDIAGPAFLGGEPYGYTGKGGTGCGVRTLVQVAQDVADGRL